MGDGPSCFFKIAIFQRGTRTHRVEVDDGVGNGSAADIDAAAAVAGMILHDRATLCSPAVDVDAAAGGSGAGPDGLVVGNQTVADDATGHSDATSLFSVGYIVQDLRTVH